MMRIDEVIMSISYQASVETYERAMSARADLDQAHERERIAAEKHIQARINLIDSMRQLSQAQMDKAECRARYEVAISDVNSIEEIQLHLSNTRYGL